jgi:p-hydroxybenzoate 3-monooxygenase
MPARRTQVGIIGAGPAGLLLGHLLHTRGIDSVILEKHDRAHVIERVRAGVLEQGTVDLLCELGLGARLQRQGLRHDGLFLSFGGERHHVDMAELTGGRAITIYGQNEVVSDLIEARIATGRPLAFEAADVEIAGVDTARPSIRYRHEGRAEIIECDFVAGCDGFHGVSRESFPAGVMRAYERTYPFGWLGILAEAAPTSAELVYARHDRGFALFSMRSPTITRLYLQCAPDEDLTAWPDDRIWSELAARFACRDGWTPAVGPIRQKGVTPMRSFVADPMAHGRLYLAGDAAHIVPPTGAKGLNLAVADVWRLAGALARFYRDGSTAELDTYSERGLRRTWRAQRFSWWMTSTLHRAETENAFDALRQRAELDYLVSSRAALTSFAENYVGTPLS